MSDLIFVKYKIKIVKVDSYQADNKNWNRVADTGNPKDNGPQYDYVTFKSTQHYESEILSQEIFDENLDIKSIIKAINGI